MQPFQPHQGEGDATDAAETAAWAEKFVGMIADLRSEFGDVPVVAGELGRYLDDYTRKTMNWRAINSQLHSLEGRIPRFTVVSSEGLTANRDNLHMNTKSLRVFGARYASAMLAAGRPAVKTGPDRNATALQVSLKKIGCLRPKSVREVGPSNFTIDGAPVDRDFVDFDKYCDYLEPLGVSKIRILAGWAKSEREKGKIDVAWLDHIVDWCLAHDIEPLLELSYGNPIYPGAGGAGLSDGIPNTPEGLKEWDRWVDFLGEHFKGRVNEWAMWNEPDNKLNVNTPEMIAAFNVRSAKILKKHMPDCRLHGLSLAWSTAERLESCIKPMGEDAKLFDTFVYHGYIANPDLSYKDDLPRKEVVAKYAPDARLRQGENGAPSEFGAAFALRFIPWSETSQAKYDLRRALGDLGHDLESGLFCIVDINYRPPTFPTYFCNRKGYLRLNAHNDVIQVKRAYYAIQNMVSVFNANLTRVKEPRVSSTDPSLSLFEYATRSGEPLFVFWEHGRMICERHPDRKTEYNAKIDPASGVPSDSFTTREVIFEWSGKPFNEPVWVDLITGWVYEIPHENQIVHADGITFVRIPAYDSPCFVAERRALEFE